MENSKYKNKIENAIVDEEQLAIVNIPSTLHSIDANHIVTTSDEIYDLILKKRQSDINNRQNEINAEQERLNDEFKAFIKEYGLFIDRQNEINSIQEAFNDAQRIFNTEQKEFNSNQLFINKEQNKFNEKQIEINEKQEIFNLKQNEFNSRQEKINKDQEWLNEKQKDINKDVRIDIDLIKSSLASSGGNLDAIKEILKDYVKKDELEYAISVINNSIEESLNKYYTKEEVDEAIENAEVDLSGYYTKQEVDDKFLALELEEMLKKVSASMSCSPSSVFERGTSVSHTITLRTNNFTLSDKSVLKSIIRKGSTILAESTGDTVSCVDTITSSTSYSGIVIYKDGVKSWSASCSRSGYYRTYYGFGLNEEDVFTNGHSKVTSSAKGTYNDVSTADNVYYYIIVPSDVSCPSTFTMNATPFVMNKSSLIKNNITYTVLKSGSVFGIGGEVNINAQ